MTHLLKEKNIAYVVISPQIGNIDGSGTKYLDFFKGDKTPLEMMLTQDRITLKHELATGQTIENSMRDVLKTLYLSWLLPASIYILNNEDMTKTVRELS